MTLRVVTLSGFKSSDPSGKIVVDDELLTTQANVRTAARRLSWADVRFLDDDFRKAASPKGHISNVGYLRDSNLKAGRHLFSILTGRQIHLSPGQQLAETTGNDDYIALGSSPNLTFKGGMSFPNKQILYGYQLDSDYGKLCQDGWINYLRTFSAVRTIQWILTQYRSIVYASTLCPTDMNDGYAVCVLQAWANSLYVVVSATSASGATYSFPAYSTFTPKLKFTTTNICRQTGLDFARNNLTGFSTVFQISPGYGDKAFPEIP